VAARNAAVAASTGEYIALLDADDTWLPEKLEKTISALDRSPGAVLAYSEYIPIDENGKEIQPSSFSPAFAHAPSMDEMLGQLWPFAYPTVVIRRSAYDPCEDFCAKAAGSIAAGLGGDYMFLQARERGEFIYVSEPLARIRRIRDPLAFGRWEAHTFIEVVRKRYGRRARGLIAQVRNGFAAHMALKAARQIDNGGLGPALQSWMEVMRYQPFFLIHPRNIARVFTRRSIRRVLKVLLRSA
jgi:glycosyltransferase involved in cell wall biosynthesis